MKMRKLAAPTSWDALLKQLWAGVLDRYSSEHRPYIAYRGLGKDFGDLRTGIQRLSDPHTHTGDTLRWLERRLVTTFGTYARDRLPDVFSDWDVLLLGQHYRLPTRLLDWTASPYVALFFATEEEKHLDAEGVIWCVYRHKTNKYLSSSLRRALKDQGGELFTLQTLKRRFTEGLHAFDKNRPSAPLWFEPPSIDTRIVNQYAYFSLMPGIETRQCEWFSRHSHTYRGVRVPSSMKREIRRRLDVINITERTIYGGLEGIARWLRHYYGGWRP
jgi:FRG domain